MPKPLPDIAKCKRCGSKAFTEYWGDEGYNVACNNQKRACFIGPIMKTARGAINAWNPVMGGVK